jgi:hypothetical protein
MKTSIRIAAGCVLLASAATIGSAYAGDSNELLLSAPIEKLDRTTDSVTVLGQTFHAQTDQLAIGEVVRVYGALGKDGSVQDAIVQPTETYAANGDPVFVKGVVTNTDASLGHAEVNGMTIDYTSQLSNPNFVPPSVGDVVTVAASQPLTQGALVAFASGLDAYSLGTAGGGSSVAPGSVKTLAEGVAPAEVGMNGGGRAVRAEVGMNGGGRVVRAEVGMNGGGR